MKMKMGFTSKHLPKQKPSASWSEQTSFSSQKTSLASQKTSFASQKTSFSSQKTSFSLFVEPFLNTYFQTYQYVITLNSKPPGPLSQNVCIAKTTTLSPYSTPFYNTCKYIILRYPNASGECSSCGNSKDQNAYLGPEDIPDLLGYLVDCGYVVNTSVSKMLFQSGILSGSSEGKRLICSVSFLG
jgi:hypothetical protein